jgi:hypothetical protein
MYIAETLGLEQFPLEAAAIVKDLSASLEAGLTGSSDARALSYLEVRTRKKMQKQRKQIVKNRKNIFQDVSAGYYMHFC